MTEGKFVLKHNGFDVLRDIENVTIYQELIMFIKTVFRVDDSSKYLLMPVMSFIYLTLQSITHPSVLTSWMSSPSRKRTGFRVSRWSIRKVLGSLRARTIHLKIRETYVHTVCMRDAYQSLMTNVKQGLQVYLCASTRACEALSSV